MALGISGFGSWILTQRFLELERVEVSSHLARVEALLTRERGYLESKCADWGQWDDALEFVAGRAPTFRASNLVATALTTNDLDAILYLRRDGQPLDQVIAPNYELAQLIPATLFGPGSRLMAVAATGQRGSTIAMVGALPVLIAAGPVTSSDGKGPVVGTVVTARVLDQQLIDRFSTQLLVPVTFEDWDAVANHEDPAVIGQLTYFGRSIVINADSQRVAGYASVADPDGRPLLLTHITLPRTLYQAGRGTIRDLVICAVAGIGLLGALIAYLIDRLIGRRLEHLAAEVVKLEADPERRLLIEGRDEISRLASAIDRAVHTERATASALRHSQARYLLLFEHAGEALMVLDADRIVDANRAATALFAGDKQRALTGCNFSELLVSDGHTNSDDSSSWSTSDERRLAQMRGGDGRVFRAVLRSTAIELSGRTVTQVHIEDVTRRHRREEEQAALALLADNTTEMVAVVRTSGTISYLNRAGRAMLGLDEQATLDATSLPDRLDPQVWEALRAGCQAEQGWRSEATMLIKNGTTAPVLIAANGIRDQRGRLLLFGLVVRDLTVEREREVQLETARTSAVDAARAKQEFLAMVSHELRTPLNGVIGMTSLLTATTLDRDQREFADTITVCADNLLHLINDLLDLNRFDSGALELERIPFSIREIADEATQIVAERALGKGLDLGSIVAAEVPDRIIGDPTRLRQVLVNLLANAVKFTEFGHVSMTITMGPGGLSASRQELVVAVADTGIGIAEDVLPQLFKPFTQADSSTTRRFGGSGLGLAICQRLVGMMGGEITITSRLGLGSVFQLAIPFPLTVGGLTAPSQSAGLALVVEPGPVARAAMTCRLEAHGFTVIASETLDNALLILGNRRPALACVPWSTTDLPGHDLRSALQLPDLPVIITAAITKHLDVLRCSQSGATAILSRPYRWHQVTEVLTSIIGILPQASTRPRGRILLIEDDEVIAMLVRRIIESEGHAFQYCALGQLALDQAEPGAWDLALVDIGLPDLNGYTVLRGLRERVGPGLALLAVTGGVEESDRERCLAAGCDGFLAKPFTADALLDQIRARIC